MTDRVYGYRKWAWSFLSRENARAQLCLLIYLVLSSELVPKWTRGVNWYSRDEPVAKASIQLLWGPPRRFPLRYSWQVSALQRGRQPRCKRGRAGVRARRNRSRGAGGHAGHNRALIGREQRSQSADLDSDLLRVGGGDRVNIGELVRESTSSDNCTVIWARSVKWLQLVCPNKRSPPTRVRTWNMTRIHASR